MRPTVETFMKELQKVTFFSELDEVSLRTLAEAGVWREYAEGELIALEAEPAAGLYYLHEGWVKAVKISASGREQVLAFLESGSTFNEVGIFGEQVNPVSVIALETAGVWLLPREAVRGLLRRSPDFAEQILAKMAARLVYLVGLVTDLSLRSVTARLARLLLEESADDVLHRPQWYTQSELAARLGTVSDVVQRALRSLEKEGMIRVKRREIEILDRPGLAELAE